MLINLSMNRRHDKLQMVGTSYICDVLVVLSKLRLHMSNTTQRQLYI